MAAAIKTMVSKKKNRYKGEGYNLDLTYITDRLIAMGFPAERLESLYRNSMDDVRQFLDKKHPDHYKIYNLCSERTYDATKFHGRVANYPFDDHHPPSYIQIPKFCQDVTEWLSQDQQNIAVVHCKAGKGRTGVMSCCFLLHSKVHATAKDVLDYYGKQRTQNEKGVTIPSQKRYINYYDVSLRNNLTYTSVKMYLKTVVIDYLPNLGSSDSYYLQLEVKSPKVRQESYISKWYPVKGKARLEQLEINPPLLISDDVKFEFSYRTSLIVPMSLAKSSKEFHFWLNTFFLDKDFNDSKLAHEVVITQTHQDSCCKSKPTDNIFIQSSPFSDPEESEENSSSDGSVQQVERKSSNESDPGIYSANLLHQDQICAIGSGLPERHTSGGPANSAHINQDGQKCDGCVNDPLQSVLENMVNLSKTSSISDDTLLKEQQQQRLNVTFAPEAPTPSAPENFCIENLRAAAVTELDSATSKLKLTTTHSSFITERMRHSSVPQSASSSWSSRSGAPTSSAVNSNHVSLSGNAHSGGHLAGDHFATLACGEQTPITIEGTKINLKMEKSMIDKACKNKNFAPNFNVTLLLVKPDDQSDNLIDYTAMQHKAPLSSQSSGESNGSGPWRASHPNHQPLSNSSSTACVIGGGNPRFFGGSGVGGGGSGGGSKSGGEQSSPESSSEEECLPDFERTRSVKREIVGQTSILVHDHRRRHHTKNSQPATSNTLANCNNKTEVKRESVKSHDQLSALMLPKRSNSDSDSMHRQRHHNESRSTQNSSHQFNNSLNMMLTSKAASVQSTWT